MCGQLGRNQIGDAVVFLIRRNRTGLDFWRRLGRGNKMPGHHGGRGRNRWRVLETGRRRTGGENVKIKLERLGLWRYRRAWARR
jgi:hypothetical protein